MINMRPTNSSNFSVATHTKERPPRSFGAEVRAKIRKPMLYFFLLWLAITIVIIVLDNVTVVNVNVVVVVGGIISIIGAALILFSAIFAEPQDIKMLLSGTMALTGHSLKWQENNTGWCYFIALLGQVSAMASIGWSASIVLDLLLIVYFPMAYGRNKKEYIHYYHIIVWSLAVISCIPPIAAGKVGMSPDKACWILNDYVWCFWAYWWAFVAFALCSVAAIYMKLRPDSESSSAVDKISIIHVRVVVQSWLITYTFFLCWFWNGMFRMVTFAEATPPAWLVPLQIFWLGAAGFGNSVVWAPFIKRAIQKAQERYTLTSTGSSSGRHISLQDKHSSSGAEETASPMCSQHDTLENNEIA